MIPESVKVGYYKFLHDNNTGGFSTLPWYLPKGKRPGKWMPKINHVIPCVRGYHVCAYNQVLPWMSSKLYRVEVRSDFAEGIDKCVFGQARLIERLDWDAVKHRNFLLDCALRSLARCPSIDPEVADLISEEVADIRYRGLRATKPKFKLKTTWSSRNKYHSVRMMGAIENITTSPNFFTNDTVLSLCDETDYYARLRKLPIGSAAAEWAWRVDRFWAYVLQDEVEPIPLILPEFKITRVGAAKKSKKG